MSDSIAETTPKKGGKLDHYALAYEVAMAYESGEGKPNWSNIAEIVGSASGQAALKCWQGMKKKREAERKDGPKVDGTKSNGGDDALKAKATKVEKKPTTPKKKASKATAAATAEPETFVAKTPSPKSPKAKKGGKAAKQSVKVQESPEETKVIEEIGAIEADGSAEVKSQGNEVINDQQDVEE
ncbi:MAG: hypothetical protein LQ340_002172 [Diploschistes diacapsis]|nr:MAG: hypothetical protein LQ340_002172 [Diploschistes diacapsis]